MNELTGKVFTALDNLAKNPATLLALQDLHLTFAVLRPFVEFVAPYETVCNNGTAFFTGLADHISEGVTGGTSEVVLVRTGNDNQNHAFNQDESDRPADVPSNWDPQNSVDTRGNKLMTAHLEAYGPAVDAQGHADCQAGQYGYLDGPYNLNPKYQPSDLPRNASSGDFQAWEDSRGGGSHITTRMDHPGLAGPTFVGNRLGITSLQDVR